MALTQGEDIDTGATAGSTAAAGESAGGESGGGRSFWDTIAEGAKWFWDNVIVPGAQWVWENRDMLMENLGPIVTSMLKTPVVLLGPVPLYVIESETLELEGQVTRYAIEDKDELADHVWNAPKRVVLKAFIGNPLGGAMNNGLDLGGPEFLHLALTRLHVEKTPVTYVSRMAVWPNMVVTRYRPTLTPRHVNAYYAEIVLEQVKFGQEPGEPQAPQPEEPQDQGNATEGAQEPPPEDKSLLRQFIEGIGEAIGKRIFGGGEGEGAGEGTGAAEGAQGGGGAENRG